MNLKSKFPGLTKFSILDLIYPSNLYCASCGDCIESHSPYQLCNSCMEKINWLSENPFEKDMDSFAFDELFACCIYDTRIREIIHAFKLGGKRYLSRPLALLMSEKLLLECPNLSFDYICCVPSSKEKQRIKGFNQAKLLSKEISRLVGIPHTDLLVKKSGLSSMRLKSGQLRRTSENPFKPCEDAPSILGKRILLIDDVLTTGSTASDASMVLKNAGAIYVGVLCFASSSGNLKGYSSSSVI